MSTTLKVSACSSYQHLLWHKLDLPRRTSSKSPGKIKIIVTDLPNVINTKYYIKYSSKYNTYFYPFFLLHNFKLKTDVLIE